MTRLSGVVFLVSTFIVTLWSFAESAANSARYSNDFANDFEDKNSPEYKDNIQHMEAIAIANSQQPFQLNTEESGSTSKKFLTCYSCVDCPKVYKNTTRTPCPLTLDPLKQNKCVTFAQTTKYSKDPWHVRGCASEKGSCLDIQAATLISWTVTGLEFCNECEGNLCNKNFGHRPLANITMALLALVVCPLIAKLSLS